MDTPSPDVLLSLAEAAKLPWLPRRRRGKRPSIPTLWRWARHGCYGVRLKTVSVGATLCVRERDLVEFFDALTRLREVSQ
jgi:hypothetical protein